MEGMTDRQRNRASACDHPLDRVLRARNHGLALTVIAGYCDRLIRDQPLDLLLAGS